MENEFSKAIDLCKKLESQLSRVIRGRSDTIRLVISSLMADGHVLLEDYPGSGKTTLSKTLGRLISKDIDSSDESIVPFRRVQFTPDMLPGDVLGVNIFEPKSGAFRFVHGPIFAHIVLADELNRAGPKVQSAFLECMAEKQVTIDNVTHKLHSLFFVLGTQNPLDLAGTYPLPLVQLDRFLYRLPMSYVDRQTELQILEDHDSISELVDEILPITSPAEIISTRKTVAKTHVAPIVRETIIDIIQATRNEPLLQFGASTRAGLMLQKALKAFAVVNERDYVTDDDLKIVAPVVLGHRLKFHGSAQEQRQGLEEFLAPHIERLIGKALKP